MASKNQKEHLMNLRDFRSMIALAAVAACVTLFAADYDVIVAGGGPAGIGAGYTAAQRGAKTHPGGGSSRSTGVPSMGMSFFPFSSSRFGMERSRPCVYGCMGE